MNDKPIRPVRDDEKPPAPETKPWPWWQKLFHGHYELGIPFGQPEPFRIDDYSDGVRGKSLVIPIPKTDRALRIGFNFRGWCHLGPRRYKVIMTRQALEGMMEIWGAIPGHPSEEEMKDDLRKKGIIIEGDLQPVEGEGDGPGR